MADFHQIWSWNVVRRPVAESGKTFSKILILGVICPPNLTSTLGQTGTSLSSLRAATGHVTECTAVRYCILHVVVQGPWSFRGPVNFFVRHTVAELPGVKVAQFSDFGLFFPYKTRKTYLPVTNLQLRGYIAEWFRFFLVVVEGPKGCLPAAEFSYDFWYGSCGPPNLPKFSPMANGYILTECTTRRVRSGPKMSENA